jgi:hypothetical protein
LKYIDESRLKLLAVTTAENAMEFEKTTPHINLQEYTMKSISVKSQLHTTNYKTATCWHVWCFSNCEVNFINYLWPMAESSMHAKWHWFQTSYQGINLQANQYRAGETWLTGCCPSLLWYTTNCTDNSTKLKINTSIKLVVKWTIN